MNVEFSDVMVKVTSPKIASKVPTIRPVINAANPATSPEVVRIRRIVPTKLVTVANARGTFPETARTRKFATFATSPATLREIVKKTITESSSPSFLLLIIIFFTVGILSSSSTYLYRVFRKDVLR